ncbi:MAG: DUF2220 family protein [Candidatus Methanoperedens sp.]|uniref:Wadjet anti-phage system protein JetD domain-containing protein n=1 Tax=Candidatus Methanoperedens sp. BLZ2 TaxID=2035255 RepID=UPI000BE300EA|nr:Wadjet anti-phage system protein JetD domain-containing protein [Candidatus Methanoperedens sp. BLZ2]KAB2942728.1 MAG: hypothetical protein F9K14_16810 [Candidatus Methanoperedens sp.]MBZ0175369.1 hypothetical protein [Candidatus Methanoperedens nitroreducens]MCX9079511.1 DUF2220 family protein [Candidatus Methanoperedens sp.]
MTNPSGIKKKAERLYHEYLTALLKSESFFPKEIPFGRVNSTDDYNIIKREVKELINGSKDKLGYGYKVELSQSNTRKYGLQSFPCRIYFENETDYLKYIKKEKEVSEFKIAISQIRETIPSLNDWIDKNTSKVIGNIGKWNNILKVCEYFQKNTKPNLYIRELPIEIHTKFIEENKGTLKQLLDFLLPNGAIKKDESEFEKRFYLRYDEPLIRVRALDQSSLAKYNLSFSDFSIPIIIFNNLKIMNGRFIITENKMNFLTLPYLKDTFGLFVGGFGIEILKQIDWLKNSNIFYWGDIDAQGFQILSQIRSYFPHTKSVMMDFKTLNLFQQFIVSGTPTNTNIDFQNLTDEEKELFNYLCEKNFRLEQEKINQYYINENLKNLT